jgi:hypothetical protein
MPERPETVSERDRAIRAIVLGLALGVVLVLAARRSR